MLLQDDEKDLQQILVLAARILERQNMQNGAPFSRSSAPDVPPVRRIPERKGGKKIIMFPVQTNAPQARDIRRRIEPTEQPTQKQQQPPASEEAKSAAEKTTDESPIFDEKELNAMPRYFRKIFRTDKTAAHVRKKRGVYEIRFQADGVRLSASSKTLQTAKEKFVSLLCDTFPNGNRDFKPRPHTPRARIAERARPLIVDYIFDYLETFKRPNVCEKYYLNLCRIVRKHIAPFFVGKKIDELTATDCQRLLVSIQEQNKGRTVEEVRNILSWISGAAVADQLLPADVMARVQTLPHRRTCGKSIPADLMRPFLARVPETPAEVALLFLAYSGVRPCELFALSFDDCGFVTVRTAKRKKWEIQDERRFPVHPDFLPYLEHFKNAPPVTLCVLEKNFRKFFPREFRLYDLRHTFTTAAQQSHCYKSWVDYVTGHKANGNTTDRVYTHWSDEWQLEEMARLHF